MRAIRDLLVRADGRYFGQPVTFDVFETRLTGKVPDLSYDLYLSSGGPGSPFDGQGKRWEYNYFRWLEKVYAHNERVTTRHEPAEAKHALFICHSYQMMCRFFGVAEVVERRSQSFGIFPVHMTPSGRSDPLFDGLPEPFFAADFRHWQVIQPDTHRLADLGARVLALEKLRPRIELERATMAMRITPEIVGVQFHPEADPVGMRRHFKDPERKELVVRRHGFAKYERILHRLEDPSFLKRTHDTLIPNFLRRAVGRLRPEALAASG